MHTQLPQRQFSGAGWVMHSFSVGGADSTQLLPKPSPLESLLALVGCSEATANLPGRLPVAVTPLQYRTHLPGWQTAVVLPDAAVMGASMGRQFREQHKLLLLMQKAEADIKGAHKSWVSVLPPGAVCCSCLLR